ncbi:MAG: GNAT family N-acetyltransferase [Deltaproteobacteria bacterium]|nr:GNAT family N-acetyltransferase [Deltaproteobacteria bacterium]
MNSLRPNVSLEQFLNYRDDFLANGYQLFGAVIDDEVACVAGLIIYPHIVRRRDCWVYDLATLENYRSQGHGKRMLEFLEKYARSHGCSRLCLHTNVANLRAQHFYENHANYKKFGYVYISELA